jgi:hypothetical protein
MDIQTAGNFLGASLLFGVGIAFIGVVIVFLNNIISKYWKPLHWFKFMNFVDEKQYPKMEIKEPVLGEPSTEKKTKN